MAAPSISGFTEIEYTPDRLDFSAGLSPDFGEARTSNEAQTFDFGQVVRVDSPNPAVAGQSIVTYPWSSDFSGVTAIAAIGAVSSTTEAETVANNGFFWGVIDTSDNYKIFTIAGSDVFSPVQVPYVIQPGQTADLTGGTIDESDIDRIGFGFTKTGILAFQPRIIWDQFIAIQDPTILNGELNDPATLGTFFSELESIHLIVEEPLTGVSKFNFPLKISAEYFIDRATETIVFEENALRLKIDNNYYYIELERPTATAVGELANKTFQSSLDFRFECLSTSDKAEDFLISNVTFSGGGTSIYREGFSINGGSEIDRTLVQYSGGSVINRVLSDSPLQIDCAPGDNLSTVNFRFIGTVQQLNLNPSSAGASVIDLTGLEADGTLDIRNDTANAITVLVDSGLTTTTVNNAGGTVTVQTPQVETTVVGFPTSNTDYADGTTNSIDPEPCLGIYDASVGAVPAGLLVSFTPASPEYNGDGSYTIVAGDYADDLDSGTDILVVGNAIGWKPTSAITVDTNSPPGELDLAPAFEEYLDEAGFAFIGSSVPTTGLTYDQVNARFELAENSGGATSLYDFAGVAYRQELITNGTTGFQSYAPGILRLIQYLSNDFAKQIVIPPQLKISSNSSATSRPIIADFVVRCSNGCDPFESISGRPDVLIRFQAPATEINLTQVAGESVSGVNDFKATGFSTFDPATDAVTVATNQDKTGYSITQSFPANFADLAIDGSGQVTAGNMRGTDGAYTDTPPTAASIRAEIDSNSTQLAAIKATTEAVTDGRFVVDYDAATATQYNADGTIRTVFDLIQPDGSSPATTASNAVERRPQP